MQRNSRNKLISGHLWFYITFF